MINCIDKVYVVSLTPDRDHRWELFEKLKDPRIERFKAVDTRKPWKALKIAEKNGFHIDPAPGACCDYFSQSKGAVGCFLSHYKIWKKVVADQIPCTLVVEDDAEASDIHEVLTTDTAANPGYLSTTLANPFHCIQINKRTPQHDVMRMFAGTESYLISLEGARRFIKLAENADLFTGILKRPTIPKNNEPGGVENETIEFKKTETYRMWIAVDKFMGFCSSPDLPEDLRVNIIVNPRVKLHETAVISDIINYEKQKPHWKMVWSQVNKFRRKLKYRWWQPVPKVFEIGVKKTGTTSLGRALGILGYRFTGWHPELYKKWKDTQQTSHVIEAAREFDAFEDGPWHDCEFRDLDAAFPDAKFIILLRDDKSWIESLEKHESPNININNISSDWLEPRWVTDRDGYIEEMLQFKHNKYQSIREHFKDRPGKLLELNVFEDDNPYVALCDFLGLEQPAKHNRFPHANQSSSDIS